MPHSIFSTMTAPIKEELLQTTNMEELAIKDLHTFSPMAKPTLILENWNFRIKKTF